VELADLAADVARRFPRFSRRDVFQLAAFSAALVACKKPRRADNDHGASGSAAPEPAQKTALDATAFRALEAATARILPAAADFAGARDAHVMTFIDRQLAIAPFARLAPAMLALAHALDQQATARGKPAFAALDVAEQDQVLEQLARGEWKGVQLPQRELFRVLHGLTLEGFLADPVHGGNQDGVGWKAIDFAEPPLRTPGAGHDHGG
jgi:gluconate 2-dehydrogenase gamma chain